MTINSAPSFSIGDGIITMGIGSITDLGHTREFRRSRRVVSRILSARRGRLSARSDTVLSEVAQRSQALSRWKNEHPRQLHTPE